MTEGFTERASLIGPNASLLGILALPAANLFAREAADGRKRPSHI